MPDIRFTEEDHAFAQEFVDRLESSGVAGTVREFLSKEDADWLLAQTEREVRNTALMMRLAEAVITTAVGAGLAEREGRGTHEARYKLHYDNFGIVREDDDYQRRHQLEKKLPSSPNENESWALVTAFESLAVADMKRRTGLNESETVA